MKTKNKCNQTLVSLLPIIKCKQCVFPELICSVRVSNELGASHPKLARFSVIVVNGTSLLISIIFSAIILIFRIPISKLFTTNSTVIEVVSRLIPLLAISVLLNGIQPILSGNINPKMYKKYLLLREREKVQKKESSLYFLVPYSRCCYWMWMASFGSLCQFGCLLSCWSSHWLCPWF